MTLKKPLVLLLFSLILAACANRADTEPKAVIAEKAQARWDARISGDTQYMYDYLSPSLQTLTTKSTYNARFAAAINYKKAIIDNIVCDNEKDLSAATKCKVTMSVTYEASMPMTGKFQNTRPIFEKWVKEDGDWWLYDN